MDIGLEREGRVELDNAVYERVAPGVALVTLNRPDDANGLIPALAADLLTAWDALESDRSIRAVVLTGAGRQFSGGADLNAIRDYLREDLHREQEAMNLRAVHPVTKRVVTSRLPAIAAINGGATAAGLDLALACDIRIASSRAKLGETYVRIGMAPGNGGTWFLPRLVGSGMAAELALTGDVLDAPRALEIGLVNHVVEPDELHTRAIELAARIARAPAHVLEATKQALRHSLQVDLPAAMDTTFWACTALHYSDDFREGVDAFLDKREPRFTDPSSEPSSEKG